jgi:hypothetical protein
MTRALMALAAAMFLSTVAHAQTGETARLLNRERALDGICRGGTTDDEMKRGAACCERTQVGVRLNRLGWCYGKRGQIGADMDWHHCTRASERFKLGDYCP